MEATPDFGHQTITIGGSMPGHLDIWGLGPFIITTEGKSFRFEDSDRNGPALIKMNGDLKDQPYPPEKSPFWLALACWKAQGRQTGTDGITCIWRVPKPTMVRLEGRAMFVVERGEKYGATICIVSGRVIRKAGVS